MFLFSSPPACLAFRSLKLPVSFLLPPSDVNPTPFAPPYLLHKDLVLSQTPNILLYLSGRVGAIDLGDGAKAAKAPATLDDASTFHHQELLLTILDVNNEVSLKGLCSFYTLGVDHIRLSGFHLGPRPSCTLPALFSSLFIHAVGTRYPPPHRCGTLLRRPEAGGAR